MKKPIHVAIPHLWELPNSMVADRIRVPASQPMNIRSAEQVLLTFLDLPDHPSIIPLCVLLHKTRFSELCRALRGAVGTFLMQEHTKKKDGIPIEEVYSKTCDAVVSITNKAFEMNRVLRELQAALNSTVEFIADQGNAVSIAMGLAESPHQRAKDLAGDLTALNLGTLFGRRPQPMIYSNSSPLNH